MASYDLPEPDKKKQYIEIWLEHIKVSRTFTFFYVFLLMSLTKSSAKSSYSSLQSISSSSISSAARSSTKAIGCGIKQGIKHIKKGANAITRPLKRAKHALSNVLSLIISDAEDPIRDEASVKANKLPEVIDLKSDSEELDDLEKELGTFTQYSFLTISLISILSSSQEDLEVPSILILQS